MHSWITFSIFCTSGGDYLRLDSGAFDERGWQHLLTCHTFAGQLPLWLETSSQQLLVRRLWTGLTMCYWRTVKLCQRRDVGEHPRRQHHWRTGWLKKRRGETPGEALDSLKWLLSKTFTAQRTLPMLDTAETDETRACLSSRPVFLTLWGLDTLFLQWLPHYIRLDTLCIVWDNCCTWVHRVTSPCDQVLVIYKSITLEWSTSNSQV